MAQTIKKWQFEAGFFAAALIVAILLYVAYRRSLFPFTDDTKKKIHNLIYGPSSGATTTAQPPLPPICLDGSIVNPTTGLCRNGSKPTTASVTSSYCPDGTMPNAATGLCTNGQQPIQVAPPPPGAPGTGVNALQDVMQPTGGTGAISLQNAQAVANPYGLYCADGTNPDPTTQICDDGSTPGAKPDANVERIFQQEMYKQLFLPYQKYPYLYGPNYTQALLPQYAARCQDGSTPDSKSGLCANGAFPVPNPGDVQSLANNPYAAVFGALPPIQGGDIPQTTQDQQALQYYQQQQLAAQYGLFPPGGYTTNPQTTAPLPGTPSADGTGLGSICFTDSQGIQWCPSPGLSANTPGCTTIQGVVYCNNATVNQPTPSGVGTGQSQQGCFTVGNTVYCQMVGGDPANPPANCVTDGTNVYCPSASSSNTAPGGTPAQVSTCFQLGSVTYCQSTADPSTPGCTVINGKTYCAIAGPPATTPPTTPPPSTTPPTTTPGTPAAPPATQGCFTAADGTDYCPCDTPVTGSIQAGGQLFCPQAQGAAGACFTTSDGTDYCPCTTATAGAIEVNQQLYCVKPTTPTPTPPPQQCVQTVMCMTGHHWDSTQCQCVEDTPSPTPPPPSHTCPTGYTYDTTNDVCIQIPATGQPSCGQGEVWDPAIGICHIQCAAGFFFDPSLDTCRGSCPSGTSWDPTRAACVSPQPATPPPPPVTQPPPPPSPPPQQSCSGGFTWSNAVGQCVNCGKSNPNCCGPHHNGNCHSECCHGSCNNSSSCQQCLSVCGSYEGAGCNCHSGTARLAQAKFTSGRAMRSYMTGQKKQAYAAVNATAADKRRLAKAMLTAVPKFIPSAVVMRDLPRGGSWKLVRT